MSLGTPKVAFRNAEMTQNAGCDDGMLRAV
jgi:hypothetical protein